MNAKIPSNDHKIRTKEKLEKTFEKIQRFPMNNGAKCDKNGERRREVTDNGEIKWDTHAMKYKIVALYSAMQH